MASAIFGNPAFTRFWTARSASGFAYHMTAVAVGWQVYALTGSTLMLGLVGLVEFLPQFLLTLVVGQVADRFDRRRIAGVCQLVEAAALLLLLAEAAGGLLGLGGIFACVALIGAARAFETPTLQALLPSLVAPESLPRMLAWSGSVWKTAMILGPAAGGLLYMLGPGVVYGLGAVVYVLASLMVLSIPAAAKVSAPAGGAWSLAGRAVPWRPGHVALSHPFSAHAPGGAHHVRGGGCFRPVHHRFRPVALLSLVRGRPGRTGGRGHDQRGHPLHPGADRHARCPARPGQRC